MAQSLVLISLKQKINDNTLISKFMPNTIVDHIVFGIINNYEAKVGNWLTKKVRYLSLFEYFMFVLIVIDISTTVKGFYIGFE